MMRASPQPPEATTTLSLRDAIEQLSKNDPDLRVLQLDGCQFTRSYERIRFRHALAANTVLEELSLSRNHFGDWSQGKLNKFIDGIVSCSSLQKLIINKNNFNAESVEHLVSALIQRSEEAGLAGLSSLCLSSNRIGNEGARLLSDMLQNHDVIANTLKELSVNDNAIGDAGAIALSEFIRGNTRLKQLNLRRNIIEGEGCNALAEVLPHSRLEQLVLDFNTVSDTGAVALSNALSKNPTLKVLHLKQNAIKVVGGLALASSLCENTRLTDLDLSFQNPIEQESVQAFTQIVTHCNKTIQKLTLWNRYQCQELQYVVGLNRVGRGYIGDVNLPCCLWSLILHRASKDPTLLYFVIQSRPDLFRRR